MLNNEDLKELFTQYKAGNATLAEMQDCINYNISLCQTTLASLNEPVTSTLWDVASARTKSRQLLTQIEVKLRSFLANVETLTAYDTGLESLINQYKACEFGAPINLSSNMDMPNFLDVNLWIKKGELMTPLNDMIWRPTKRYDEGDIVMCFLDGIFYANIDYNGTNTYWSFKSKGYNQYQGIDLRPVYFICKKGCINEHPFNNNMGKCLVRNSINYYAVEITSIIRLNKYKAFSTKWFNNKTYWEPITNLQVLINEKGMSTEQTIGDFTPIGNFVGSTTLQISRQWPVIVGWTAYTRPDNGANTGNSALGSWKAGGYQNVVESIFPNYKTTTQTTFDAAYAKWTR